MKIRAGFVSNSSSSSFVVAFSKIPHSIEDVKNEMFDIDTELIKDPFYEDEAYEAWLVAKTVFDDIKEQHSNNYDMIFESVRHGWFDGCDELLQQYHFYDNDTDWNELEKKLDEAAKELVDQFIDDNKIKQIFVLEYSDNDGKYQSFLEHGNIFRNLPNLQISYH